MLVGDLQKYVKLTQVWPGPSGAISKRFDAAEWKSKGGIDSRLD
jgi:hypothetical protein